MIKILYITSTLEQCGPNNQLYGLIRGLDSRYFQAAVLTLSEEASHSMLSKFSGSGICVDSLKLTRWEFQLFGTKALRAYLQKEQPDLIHTQGVRADYTVSRLYEYRDIHCMTLRNYFYEDYEDKYGSIRGKIYNRLHYRAIQSCLYAVCCSKSIAQKYETLFHEKFVFVQNGADMDTYHVADGEIPSSKTRFVVAGSLIPRKDPVTIMKAFSAANIKERGELYILGEGKLKEECEKVKKEGIHICGDVRDVVPYLQTSHYFISAARSEGLPNAVLEAGLCGCRLILSDIPQHREIADELPDGIVDFFKAGDTEQLNCVLQDKINQIPVNEERRKISKAFADKFSSVRMSREYQKLYGGILGRV